MLRRRDWQVIKEQHDLGVYQKDIAIELGVSPRTVSRALRRGGPPGGKVGRPRGSVLDPYKPFVDELLRSGVWNVEVIWARIRELGYPGKSTILRDYVKPKRPLRVKRATVRFETEPGRQLQVDWGEIARKVSGVLTHLYFLVCTLGFSRRFYAWITDRADTEHFLEGMIRAFEWFGGVTEQVVVDNLKSAVLGRVGGQVEWNPRFLDFAAYYGFRPFACRPYRARTKGKDERMVGYLKRNFFIWHSEAESLSYYQQLLEGWLLTHADLRVQGTVKRPVTELFAEEQPRLQPLPAVRYDTSYQEDRLAEWDGYIDVGGNRYSIPDRLRGKRVQVKISLAGDFKVFSEGEFVVEHRLQDRSQGWVTVPGHHASLWEEVRVESRPLSVYEEVGSCS